MKRAELKRQAHCLLVEDNLVEDDMLWDDSVQELRWRKWEEYVAEQMSKYTDETKRRYLHYFFPNATCKAHDWAWCKQCLHYASGRCPSYWEEKY